MNIWIAVLAGFISLLIIAVAMMGFFFLLTKAVEKSVLSEEKNNNAESGKETTIHFRFYEIYIFYWNMPKTKVSFIY